MEPAREENMVKHSHAHVEETLGKEGIAERKEDRKLDLEENRAVRSSSRNHGHPAGHLDHHVPPCGPVHGSAACTQCNPSLTHSPQLHTAAEEGC